MSYSIFVLCRAAEPVTRREIAEFVDEGVYFDEVSFDPPAATVDAASPSWERLEIRYDREPVPVIVRRTTGPELHEVIEVVEGTFYEQEVEMPNDIESRLKGT